jgi:tRNA(fMet)-specific endonuclease VapC
MGTLLDTTVFIELERALRDRPGGSAMAEVSHQLEQQLGPTEDVGIAAITTSELLHGVHRALPFDLLCARAHARLWAQLASAGIDVGAHDRLVAATAISAGWRVGTANVRHFHRIRGLDVIAIQLSE